MTPSDDLRQSLLQAVKQIEILCVNFDYKPVEDLRRLASDVVKKAAESKKTSLLPRMKMFFENTPYLVVESQMYPSLKDQFKQKYVHIIKHDVLPAIKKYYDSHPNIDLSIFEPIINIKVTPKSVLAKLAMGEVHVVKA